MQANALTLFISFLILITLCIPHLLSPADMALGKRTGAVNDVTNTKMNRSRKVGTATEYPETKVRSRQVIGPN